MKKQNLIGIVVLIMTLCIGLIPLTSDAESATTIKKIETAKVLSHNFDEQKASYDANEGIKITMSDGTTINGVDYTGDELEYRWYAKIVKKSSDKDDKDLEDEQGNILVGEGNTSPMFSKSEFPEGILRCDISVKGSNLKTSVYLLAHENNEIVLEDEAIKIQDKVDRENLTVFANIGEKATFKLNNDEFNVLKVDEKELTFDEVKDEKKMPILNKRLMYNWHNEKDSDSEETVSKADSYTEKVTEDSYKNEITCDVDVKTNLNEKSTEKISTYEFGLKQRKSLALSGNKELEIDNLAETSYSAKIGDRVKMKVEPNVKVHDIATDRYYDGNDEYGSQIKYKWFKGSSDDVLATGTQYSLDLREGLQFTEYVCKAYYDDKVVAEFYYNIRQIYSRKAGKYVVDVDCDSEVNVREAGKPATIDVLGDYSNPKNPNHNIAVWDTHDTDNHDLWTMVPLDEFKNKLTYRWYKDGITISSATSNKYTANLSDVGSTIKCDVYYDGKLVGPCTFNVGNDIEFSAGDSTYEMVKSGTSSTMEATYKANFTINDADIKYTWYAENDPDKVLGRTKKLSKNIDENTTYICNVEYKNEDDSDYCSSEQTFSFDAYKDMGRLNENTDRTMKVDSDNVYYRYTFIPEIDGVHTFSSSGAGNPFAYIEEEGNDYNDYSYGESDTANNFNLIAKMKKDSIITPHKYYLYVAEEKKDETAGNTLTTPYQLTIHAGNKILNISRMYGFDQHGTASAIANYAYDKGYLKKHDTVILATSRSFADALTASSIAGYYDAPILLTGNTNLPETTTETLKKLKPKRIITIGSTIPIPNRILKQAERAAGITEDQEKNRIYGYTLYDTAFEIAKKMVKLNPKGDKCIIATGRAFYDAASISGYAFSEEVPILLVGDSRRLDDRTIDLINEAGFKEMIIVGSNIPINDAVYTQTNIKKSNIVRLAGYDHFDTSFAIAKWSLGESKSRVQPDKPFKYKNGIGFATAKTYPDALAAGPIQGSMQSPLVFIQDITKVKKQIKQFVEPHRNEIRNLYFYGWIQPIPDSLAREVIHSVKYDAVTWSPKNIVKYTGVKSVNR